MIPEQTEKMRIDMLIARILIGKPNVTPGTLRRIVPGLDHLDDHALAQKIDYFRRRPAGHAAGRA
jgi:hypothetical protein